VADGVQELGPDRNIYPKLQAQDRSSAVQRVREMRLLSAAMNS
jgi:hypothetical protein